MTKFSQILSPADFVPPGTPLTLNVREPAQTTAHTDLTVILCFPLSSSGGKFDILSEPKEGFQPTTLSLCRKIKCYYAPSSLFN
jgi:hypothetical protein